jgi:hypothetical protein
MALLTDVDLLTIEPSVFLDATAGATKIHAAGDGALSGTTLTSAGSSFTALGIDAGHVAVVGTEALEVVQRTGATTLSVSRPRSLVAGTMIAPAAGTGLALTIWTFRRVMDQAETALLAVLGIDADHPTKPLELNAIVNVEAVRHVMGLLAVAHAFAIAAAAAPTSDSLARRQALYEREAEHGRQRLCAALDLDGDGVADATRRAAVVTFIRA